MFRQPAPVEDDTHGNECEGTGHRHDSCWQYVNGIIKPLGFSLPKVLTIGLRGGVGGLRPCPGPSSIESRS